MWVEKGQVQEKKEHTAAFCYLRQGTLPRGLQGSLRGACVIAPVLGGSSHQSHVTCSIFDAFLLRVVKSLKTFLEALWGVQEHPKGLGDL